MLDRTRSLWVRQDKPEGDRLRLFRAIRRHVPAERALYPGSYVDVAASFAFRAVTYVDMDKRAAAFFADREGVLELIAEHPGSPREPEVRFIHSDYCQPLDLRSGSFDLLISLYAGFVSEACTQYLRVGGVLLVNPSHGDVAMASLDPRYRLAACVQAREGDYRVTTTNLEHYLVPKKPKELTEAGVRSSGRGVTYTRSAFAYLFERVQ